MQRSYAVYILSSQKNGTLYIGVTNDLLRRVYEHKEKSTKGFTKEYKINQLVYYETYDDIDTAIAREKYLKKWKRKWKLNLIERINPDWEDLYFSLF